MIIVTVPGILLMPQILRSGVIFPLDATAAGVRWIGNILPLTYLNFICQGIRLRGATFGSLWFAYLVLGTARDDDR